MTNQNETNTERPNLSLDVEVAERVMKWTRLQSTSRPEVIAFLSPENLRTAYFQTRIANGEMVSIDKGDELNAPRFSESFDLAFSVRDVIGKQLFSVRLRFTETLQRIISERLNVDLLHESGIIFHLTAEDICRAAVEAMKES